MSKQVALFILSGKVIQTVASQTADLLSVVFILMLIMIYRWDMQYRIINRQIVMKGRKIMKKHVAILFSCAVAVATLFSLAHVAPVKAAPPIPYYIDWGTGLDHIDCGTFQISWSWQAYEDGITHLDKEGHMVRSNVTVHWADHFYREGTNLEAFNNSNWTGGYTWDEEGNLVTAFGHGKITLVVVPGYGAIVRDAGYIYMNYVTGEWIDHGQNHDYTDGEMTKLCGYFSGE